jgi:hypothetical protein
MLCVKNAVGEPIPELGQGSEEHSKGLSSVCTKYAWDVFPYEPSGSNFAKNANILHSELSAISIKASAKSRD